MGGCDGDAIAVDGQRDRRERTGGLFVDEGCRCGIRADRAEIDLSESVLFGDLPGPVALDLEVLLSRCGTYLGARCQGYSGNGLVMLAVPHAGTPARSRGRV